MTDDQTKHILATNLRHFREMRGLSQAALAREINDYPATVQRIEAEKTMPGAGLLTRIAEALSVRLDDLLSPPRKKLSRAS